MNIDIKQGDKFAVKAENIPDKLVPDISVSENQLLISDKDFSSRLKKKKKKKRTFSLQILMMNL